jgi:hypothetical protein
MVVLSQVISDPNVFIRISVTGITVATLIGVVAAGIAVGVIVGRQSGSNPFVQTQVVLRSDFSVAINRLITTSELQELYNPSSTLNDSTIGLNAQLNASFPNTSIKAVPSGFSGEPILDSSLSSRRKKQLSNRPSIITVNGSAYFTQNYTSNQLLTAFSNYTQTIVLVDIFGAPSAALGTFSSKYSVFTDTYLTNLTIAQVNSLQSVNYASTTAATVTAVG